MKDKYLDCSYIQSTKNPRDIIMSHDHLLIRTTIKSNLKRKVLFRGSLISILGAIAILTGGFISKGLLMIWGIPLYIVGILFIAIGLIPHRKLQQLENNPNEININEELLFTFRSRGKPVFSTPVIAFKRFEYFEKDLDYGIRAWFDQPPTHDIVIYDSDFNLEKLHKKAIKHYGCDLFFPYFSQRSHRELAEFIHHESKQPISEL